MDDEPDLEEMSRMEKTRMQQQAEVGRTVSDAHSRQSRSRSNSVYVILFKLALLPIPELQLNRPKTQGPEHIGILTSGLLPVRLGYAPCTNYSSPSSALFSGQFATRLSVGGWAV